MNRMTKEMKGRTSDKARIEGRKKEEREKETWTQQVRNVEQEGEVEK